MNSSLYRTEGLNLQDSVEKGNLAPVKHGDKEACTEAASHHQEHRKEPPRSTASDTLSKTRSIPLATCSSSLPLSKRPRATEFSHWFIATSQLDAYNHIPRFAKQTRAHIAAATAAGAAILAISRMRLSLAGKVWAGSTTNASSRTASTAFSSFASLRADALSTMTMKSAISERSWSKSMSGS